MDDIKNNAKLLEQVIIWVNAQKAVKNSTEKNVVIGQSMGGIVARYALADMEKRNVNHDTRLFISHDAPQQGANVPLSIQYLYRHVQKQYVKINQTLYGNVVTIPIAQNNGLDLSYANSILDKPAAKQLISNWSNADYGVDNSVHDSFYNQLRAGGLPGSGGYPTLCRNVAISNGAECGYNQNFNPGAMLMGFYYNRGLSFWGDIFSMLYIPLGAELGGNFIDSNLFQIAYLGTQPGHSKFIVQFLANSVAYGGQSQYYKGYVSYTKKVLWAVPVTVQIMNTTISQPINLPFDSYGGGFYDTTQISGSIPSFVPEDNLFVRDRFNFIPTTSSLDIGAGNVVLGDSDYLSAYVGGLPPAAPKNSPFANFTTEYDRFDPFLRNRPHISFSERNGNWLVQELSNVPVVTDCSAFCAGAAIIGPATVCSTGTYTISSQANTFNWSVIGGNDLVTTSFSNVPQFTITAVDSYHSGYVTIRVVYSSQQCGTSEAEVAVWVGPPYVASLSSNYRTDCSSSKFVYYVFSAASSTGY